MQFWVIMVTDPPTHTSTPTHKQTGLITIHYITASMQCKHCTPNRMWKSSSVNNFAKSWLLLTDFALLQPEINMQQNAVIYLCVILTASYEWRHKSIRFPGIIVDVDWKTPILRLVFYRFYAIISVLMWTRNSSIADKPCDI